MSKVDTLSKPELDVYIAEAADCLEAGLPVDDIASSMNWDVADVTDLLALQSFQTYLEDKYPGTYKVFLETTKLQADQSSARSFAKSKMLRNVQELQVLAESAKTESVKYNAIISMIKFGGGDEDISAIRSVEMPAAQEKKIALALQEVLEQERAVPL